MLGHILFVAVRMPKEPRERIFSILFLIALNPVFWALYEQAGGSLNLYTDRYVDRAGVPASLFQSINPIYIVLLSPVFAAMWQWLGKRGLEPSAPAKFGLAIIQLGIGFFILVWGANAGGREPDSGDFRFLDLPAEHDGGIVPFAGRALGDDAAFTCAVCQLRHRGVVLHECSGQLHRRQDRRGDRRGQRGDVA